MNFLSLLSIMSLILLLSCSVAEKLPPTLTSSTMITSTISEHKLKPCPTTPNCINSEYLNQSSHYLPALDYPLAKKNKIMARIKVIILAMGGEVRTEKEFYIRAIFTSSLFKFIDDFEVRQDIQSNKIHFRSASRLGFSDFGVNKSRVEKFSELFKMQITNM